jgi:RNA polymerase-binding transcription factor DksA
MSKHGNAKGYRTILCQNVSKELNMPRNLRVKAPKTKGKLRGGREAFHAHGRVRKPAGKRRLGGQRDIPSRWAWHYEALSSLREGLIRERKERLSEVAQPIEPHSMNLADSATDEFDHEIALSRLSVDQDALYEVEAAMKRILDGTYGICEQTGRPIPAARLKALPWTRFRKEVATRLERIGVIPLTRLGPLRSVREEGTLALMETEPTMDELPLPNLDRLAPDEAEE